MIELALLVGLGAVGYMLAKDQPSSTEHYSNGEAEARPTQKIQDEIVHTQQEKGHNNEVPFFGANVTQSMYSGATDAKPGVGQPFGNQVESDFMQSRMVSGQNMNNVFPIDQVRVGPGANDGYTNLPKGGYQQDQLREFTLPPTTDELRVATKPKLSYEPPVVPGANSVTMPGIQADVKKNKPDRFAIYGMDRVNTAVGAQTAPTIYAEQPMKPQARETTEKEYFGSIGGTIAILAPYVRAFTEPYQEFMRLTAEGRPGPAGAQGTGFSMGPETYSAVSNRNEQAIIDAARMNGGANVVGTASSAEHLGSYRYNTPLKEDALIERTDPSYLDAFKKNPYAQPLNSF